MSATKTIFRRLAVTVCVLLGIFFLYSTMILDRPETTTNTLPYAGEKVESVSPYDASSDELGPMLDGIEIVYAF